MEIYLTYVGKEPGWSRRYLFSIFYFIHFFGRGLTGSRLFIICSFFLISSHFSYLLICFTVSQKLYIHQYDKYHIFFAPHSHRPRNSIVTKVHSAKIVQPKEFSIRFLEVTIN